MNEDRDRLKLPLPNEIAAARKFLDSHDLDLHCESDFARRTMASWEGEGWHQCEVYYGILIGLQIATARKR